MASGDGNDDDRGPHLPRASELQPAEDLVEVYWTASEIAAAAVIEEILAPAGVEAYRHDRRSHALPAPSAMAGEIGVAVPAGMVERAREVLREAAHDGVLGEGEILEEDEGGGRVA